MPQNNYVISLKAKGDIKSIAKYTIETFGERQSLKYAKGLKTILGQLADNPDLGRRYMAVKNRMLLRFRYKSHVIFYYLTKEGIFIVRVLSGRMDFSKYLK